MQRRVPGRAASPTVLSGDSERDEAANLAQARRWTPARWPSTATARSSNLYGVGVLPDHRVRATTAARARVERSEPHRGTAAPRDAAAARMTDVELDLTTAGSSRSWRRSSRSWPRATPAWRAARARSPREMKQRLRDAERPLHRRRRPSTCARTPCPGPTASSCARSASTPTTDRTPVEPVALDRLKHGGLRSREPARRRARDRDRRDRRAGDGARRRPGGRRARPAALPRRRDARRASGRCRRARSWSPTPSARWRSCSARSRRTRGVTPETERMLLCALGVKGVPRSRRGGALDASRRCCVHGGARRAERRARRPRASHRRRVPLHDVPDERAARRTCSSRSRGSRPSCRRSSAPTWPRKGFDWRSRAAAAGRGCSRSPSSRSCATTSPSALRDARRALSDRTYVEEQNRRLIEEMLLEPEKPQVGAGLGTRTSASAAASTGTCARAGASSACC